MRCVKHVAHTREIRNSYTILKRISEEKKPLDKPKQRWEDNTTLDFKEIRCEDVEQIHLAQYRVP
jgi:hypothetical protein